jgi:peptidoglycan-N-acetylmuramic acid deacetylase
MNMRIKESSFARKRRREIIFSCVFFLALLGMINALPSLGDGLVMQTSGGVDNWGLSFPEPGKTPVGNAEQSFLSQYNAYYVGNTGEQVIYLTFDAGFENGCTEQILDVLKQHHVPAAFFLVGSYIRDHGDLVKRMVEDGHIVGNHTNTHPDMSAISDLESFKAELTAVEDAYREVIGSEMPKFYRPPQGKYSENNLSQAQELGYKTVFWSLAYVDWYEDDQPTKEEAFAKLLPRIHNGAIVLLHSTSKTNAAILDELLTEWEGMGYTFKSLADLPEAQMQNS